MYISLNWLKDYVDIKEQDPKVLAHNFTIKTAEVESVFNESKSLKGIVVGHVKELNKHPDADKLKVALTDVGDQTLQIVCGGTNLEQGMYVAVALPGAEVKWHGEGDPVKIEKVKLRGVESTGMICQSAEIGLENTKEGPTDILDLTDKKPKPGTALAELLDKNDTILEFDNKSLTHRPDLWGHYGIARELAVITDQKLKPLEPNPKIPSKGESVEVEVKNQQLCPRYCGLIIDNIKVEESPDWLKKRLQATGHGVHNNIVDITNYVMTELGQPMHAFDHSYIKGKIIVRTAEDNEKIKALDDKEYKLSSENLIIADTEKPVAVAGVIGGEHSGVNEKTTKIILESANFHPISVRRTSSKLGVRTDSVQRFEKSLDPHMAEFALKRAAEIILDICPTAKIAGPITDIKDFDETPFKTKLSISRANSKIGVEIDKKEITEILNKLEFETKTLDDDTLEVTIPSFRATKDIDIEDDLVEEIARIYGYDKIPALLPHLPTATPEINTERVTKHQLRQLLSLGLGFDEISTYSFYGKNHLDRCLMTEDDHLQLLNYLSEELTHLRTTLVPTLLKAIQLNAKNFDEFRLYEIGRTYVEIGQPFPLEEKKITGAIVSKENNDNPFYEAKGAVEEVFKKLNINELKEVKEVKNAPYAHPHKSLTYIDHDGETIAQVFIPHPQVLKNHDLDHSIAIFEINFSELMQLSPETRQFHPLPRFPKIKFDVSVLIDREIEIQTLKDEIKKANETLITNIRLFDIYEGKNIPENKKAVAFTITLQAEDRTLTDEEMADTQSKVFLNLEKLGGTIRGK